MVQHSSQVDFSQIQLIQGNFETKIGTHITTPKTIGSRQIHSMQIALYSRRMYKTDFHHVCDY